MVSGRGQAARMAAVLAPTAYWVACGLGALNVVVAASLYIARRPFDLGALDVALCVAVASAAVIVGAVGTWGRRWRDGGWDRELELPTTLLVLAVFDWMASLTLSNGSPASGTAQCRYQLVSHGFHTCVSHARYQHEQALMQAMYMAILIAGLAGAAFIASRAGRASAPVRRPRPKRR